MELHPETGFKDLNLGKLLILYHPLVKKYMIIEHQWAIFKHLLYIECMRKLEYVKLVLHTFGTLLDSTPLTGLYSEVGIYRMDSKCIFLLVWSKVPPSRASS